MILTKQRKVNTKRKAAAQPSAHVVSTILREVGVISKRKAKALRKAAARSKDKTKHGNAKAGSVVPSAKPQHTRFLDEDTTRGVTTPS